MEQEIKSIQEIYADQIVDPENPMRTEMDRERIWDLAESIKREGLINPITVRPKNEKFEVVAGHRRFVACKMAGVVKIFCVVKELNDEQCEEFKAHENLFREDIDPVDEALFLGRLIGEEENKIPDVAKKINRSEQWVKDRLAILEYPQEIIFALRSGQLKLGVAEWLAGIEDDFWRKQYIGVAVSQGMSVLQARYLHDQWKMGVLPSSESILPSNSDIANVEPPRARATCAACGRIAIDPNLQNIFVHKECPQENSVSASADSSKS